MSRKTRISLSLVAEFDHDNSFFNIKNQREGHVLVIKIKEMLSEIVQERKIKFLLKRNEACFTEDPEEKIPELKKLYLENEILCQLVDSLKNNNGRIELQVINENKHRSKSR